MTIKGLLLCSIVTLIFFVSGYTVAKSEIDEMRPGYEFHQTSSYEESYSDIPSYRSRRNDPQQYSLNHSYNGQNNTDSIAQACRTTLSAIDSNSALSATSSSKDLKKAKPPVSQASPFVKWISKQGNSAKNQLKSSLCMMMQSNNNVNPYSSNMFIENVSSQSAMALIGMGAAWAKDSEIPFLTRLEVDAGFRGRTPYGQVLTVQPLWHDKEEAHHVFTQLSWNRTDDPTDNKPRDTLNSGLAYRYLLPNEQALIGTNIFFDHNLQYKHNRMSVGLDFQTSLIGASFNRYVPLTQWKSIDALREERALGGYDMELRGQLPSLPAWTAFIKGYQWDSYDLEPNIQGVDTRLEWAPFHGLRVGAGMNKESNDSVQLQVGMRYIHSFGNSLKMQFQPVTELASVKSRTYDRVWRENSIRVQQRQKLVSQLSVVSSSGANTFISSTSAGALTSGLGLTVPVTINIANSPLAHAALKFPHGGILMIGQNSQVQIDDTQITLINGAASYISGNVSMTVMVPGGTITMMGTDIDFSTSGSVSLVRVRDGSIRMDGLASGSAVVQPGQAAIADNGVVTMLNNSDPLFSGHTNMISEMIERVVTVQTSEKAAPYSYIPPQMLGDAWNVGDMVKVAVRFSKPVTVTGGTPQLMLTINGNSRTAPLLSGSGETDIVFGYTILPADAGSDEVIVEGIHLNSSTIQGQGKTAVTTFSPVTLPLGGTVPNTIAPTGYNAQFTTDPINELNKSAAGFEITSAEIGTVYHYTITSTGGGTDVTGTGPVTSTTQTFSNIDLSSLNDGILTLSVTLTNDDNNTGIPATANVIKDTAIPNGYTVAFTTDPINAANRNAAGFIISGTSVGMTYDYSITSSAGGTPVTGSGTITGTTQNFSGLDLSSLNDGTLTISVTLSSASGNEGPDVTDTVTKNIVAPTGYGVNLTTDPISTQNENAIAFNLTGATIGDTYHYNISSDGGGTPVTGTGSVTSATQSFTGIDVSGLSDGVVTVSITLTNTMNNTGNAVTDTAAKDTILPTGYSVNFTSDPINDANKNAASFEISGGIVGSTYTYQINSSGGGTQVTGSGTITSATQNFTGIDVSGLNDGTLAISIILTSTSNNEGAPATDNVTKNTAAPTGYAVNFTPTIVNHINQSAIGFEMTGAETGSTYSYSISSSAGGTPVTGTGSVIGATQSVSAIDVSGLNDGTLTISMTLTNTANNTGAAATDTIVKNTAVPSGYAVAFTTTPLNSANQNAAAFEITGATIGHTYNYSISSSNGGAPITGTGTIASTTQSFSGINTSSLSDGVLTVSMTLTSPANNIGAAVTDTVNKNTAAPTGYAVNFTTDPLYSGNHSNAGFDLTGATAGDTYAYTITSNNGGTPVTGSGTVTASTQSFSGIDLSNLTDGTLTISMTLTNAANNTGAAATDTVVKNSTAPTGYTVSFTTDPVNSGNQNAAAFSITGAGIGTSYNYTISSNAGGMPVTGSGTISSATQNFTGIDVTGLNDGTLTVSMTLTNVANNTGTAATDTVTKNIVAPTGYNVNFTTDPVNNANQNAAAFRITSAPIGTSYNYTITSSNGGTPVTGTGTISIATQNFTGIDTTGLNDGTLTVSMTLTNAAGNTSIAVTDTALKDTIAPSGYTIAFATSPINSINQNAAAIQVTGATVGTTYNYTISSSGGGTPINGTGTIASTTQNFTGLDVSSLNDGTLTVSITLTDAANNTGSASINTTTKNVVAPTSYAVTFTTDPINNANLTAAAFQLMGATIGDTYNYTISSNGGGTPLTGTGTISSATQNFTGINVTSLGDGTLTVSMTLTNAANNTGAPATDTVNKDTSVLSGYAVNFTTDPINAGNQNTAAFNITGATVGASYNYTISSSAGGTPVTGTGTIASATQNFTGINVSGLNDGTLTVSMVLTNFANNPGAAVTDTVNKNTALPSGYAVNFTTDPINNANKAAAAFNITGATVGSTYNYSISSNGGGTAVTGTGTIATAAQSFTGIDTTGLNDGTLTVSMTLTNTAGNTGSPATDTVLKDVVAPTGYAATFTTDPINNANKAAVAVQVTSATVGTTYNYSITSSGGGTPVTGTGTIATATQNLTGIDTTGLNDGTLTVSVTLRDAAGNTGAAATDTVIKDVVAPTGYAVAFTTSPINAGNQNAAAFNITGATVGASYNYSISSSGGGTPITGTGTIASATQSFSGINVSTLNDGTLTVSMTLTDAANNTGLAATNTVTKSVVVAPSGYTVAFTTDPVNSSNVSAAAIRISSAIVGTTYNYTITSTGGGATVTGTGTVTSTTQNITGINMSGVYDGTATVSLTLTDPSNNVGPAVTDTVLKDTIPPSAFSVAFTTTPINNSNKNAIGFQIATGTVGAAYTYNISSSGGGTAITGSGTVSSATQSFSGIDVSTLADGTITVYMTISDAVGNSRFNLATATKNTAAAPTGYAVLFTTKPVNNSNRTAAAIRVTGATVGATYNYTITSSGGGTPFTRTGTIATATQNFTGLNLTSLSDGTLTVSLTLTSTGGEVGTAVTDTSLKDVVAPAVFSTSFTPGAVNASNQSSVVVSVSTAEIGTTYSYTLGSTGGGTPSTGSGTISSASQNFPAANVSASNDGSLALTTVLTDAAGNSRTANSSGYLDRVAPTGYTVVFTTTPINNANRTAAAIRITGAEINTTGTTYTYTITSSGGGTPVTATASTPTATRNITGINVSGLADGTLTVTVTQQDIANNVGAAVTHTTTKNVVVPSGYAVSFTTNPIDSGNQTGAAFAITGATVGNTYNYSISSSAGGTPVTGTGTIATASQTISNINVSPLNDGTLTLSLTMTNSGGNTGAAATNTVVKNAGAAPGVCGAATENGTICADGTVLFSRPEEGIQVYTTRCDAGMTWNGSMCTGTRLLLPWNDGTADINKITDIAAVDCATFSEQACIDDTNNTSILSTADASTDLGTQAHQAAQYCDALVAHGHSDWQLPAVITSGFILNAIIPESPPEIRSTFSSDFYWSSSQVTGLIEDEQEEPIGIGPYGAWAFSMLAQDEGAASLKSTLHPVRCVRNVVISF